MIHIETDMAPKERVTYNASQAAKKLGIGRVTLYRWFNKKKIHQVARDYRGRCVFTEADLKKIQAWKERLMWPGEKTRRRGKR